MLNSLYLVVMILKIVDSFNSNYFRYSCNRKNSVLYAENIPPMADIEQTKFITNLLETAVDMASGQLNATASKADEMNKKFIPLNIGFKAKHSTNIEFIDANLAREYLALPASEYSVLDSSFITRNLNDDSMFRITLPLGNFADTIGLAAPVCLQTDISVTPNPNKGEVRMHSGKIFVVPDLAARNLDDKFIDQEFSADDLPRWLVNEAAKDNSNNGGEDNNNEVPSSVQTGVDIILKWPSQISKDKAEAPLKVNAKVGVKVDLSIPLPGRISSVLGFFPLKLIINQAGSLIAKQVLAQIAPALSAGLLKDYEERYITPKNDNNDITENKEIITTTIVE